MLFKWLHIYKQTPHITIDAHLSDSGVLLDFARCCKAADDDVNDIKHNWRNGRARVLEQRAVSNCCDEDEYKTEYNGAKYD